MRADLFVAKSAPFQEIAVTRVGERVIVDDGVNANRRRGPLTIQPRGDVLLALLITTVIADEYDIAKSMALEASRSGLEQRLERALRDADRAREAHVRGGRIDAAFRDAGNNRCDERIAERHGDSVGEHLDAHVVLAEHDVRTVLLGAADRHERRRAAALYERLQLGRRQLLDEDALLRLHGARGEGKDGNGERAKHDRLRIDHLPHHAAG